MSWYFKDISALAPVTVFYSYYSSQVDCEPAQNVFPYFPIIVALLE